MEYIGGFIIIGGLGIVWILLSTACLFLKPTSELSPLKFVIWPSFPFFIFYLYLDHEFIDPFLTKRRAQQNEIIQKARQRRFAELCATHVVNAMKIHKVLNEPPPKAIYIEKSDIVTYGIDLIRGLAQCGEDKSTPLCARVGLETIEWAYVLPEQKRRNAAVENHGERGGKSISEINQRDLVSKSIAKTVETPTAMYRLRFERSPEKKTISICTIFLLKSEVVEKFLLQLRC